MTEPNGAKEAGLRFPARMRRLEGEGLGVLVEGGIGGEKGFGDPVAEGGFVGGVGEGWGGGLGCGSRGLGLRGGCGVVGVVG